MNLLLGVFFLSISIFAIWFGWEGSRHAGMVIGDVFGLMATWFLISSYCSIKFTPDAFLVRQGFDVTRFPYSQIQEVLVIPTPRVPMHSRAIRVTLPREPLPVEIRAAYPAALPWIMSSFSALILPRGSQSNFVLPHPQAEELAELIKEKIPLKPD